jgi:RNA recognition motif-containing protein
MEALPSQTLYINNINEKIKKPVLKKMLYMLFSQYGKVVKIVACKGVKLRGQVRASNFSTIKPVFESYPLYLIILQAWVTFRDVASSLNALKGKQGFNFYDKPLVREAQVKFFFFENVRISCVNDDIYYMLYDCCPVVQLGLLWGHEISA